MRPAIAPDRASPGPADAELEATGAAHVDRVRDASASFFETHAGAIADACRALASRFRAGGRLLVLGPGPAASDADHVAVEFVHPVLVGKRALPAMVLDAAHPEGLLTIARAEDIALVIAPGPTDPRLRRTLEAAGRAGLLTIGLFGAGGDLTGFAKLDHTFAVSSSDPFVVQEVQETCYHVLWELVHVFLEGRREAG